VLGGGPETGSPVTGVVGVGAADDDRVCAAGGQDAESVVQLPRHSVPVEVGGQPVTVKIAQLPGGGERVKPEIGDVEAAARALGVPAAEVVERALRALRSPGS
jgi:hypothetical protein